MKAIVPYVPFHPNWALSPFIQIGGINLPPQEWFGQIRSVPVTFRFLEEVIFFIFPSTQAAAGAIAFRGDAKLQFVVGRLYLSS